MQKRRAIVKLTFIMLAIIIGAILCFAQFRIPGTFGTWQGFASDIKLGIDLKGGVFAVYEVSSKELDRNDLDNRLNNTATRLSQMLMDKGYMEAVVVREGDLRIRVEVPDVENPDELFQLLGEPADMKFKLYSDENTFVKDTELTGKHLKNAYSTPYEGGFGIQLEFNAEGAELFRNLTGDNIGKYIEISINDERKSFAEIKEAIPNGKPVISGNFTQTEAEETAKKLLSGAFDVKLDLAESNVISASLGEDALKWSLIAGIIGLAFIIIYLAVMYRGLGIIADISLCIYAVLLIFLLWSLPWIQLSLPGIAGIILSLGMAVDANIIIFERIKEEYRLGRSISAAVSFGFKKSLWTVLDANITTIIASIVLIILGKGTIQGFGITLLIGILLSLFSSLLCSRGITKIFLQLNKNNNKFYGLYRDENVSAPPPEDGDGKSGEDKRAAIETDVVAEGGAV